MDHFGLVNAKIRFGIRSFDQNGRLDQFSPVPPRPKLLQKNIQISFLEAIVSVIVAKTLCIRLEKITDSLQN